MTTKRSGRSRRATTKHAPADLETAVADLGIEIRRIEEHEIVGMCPKHLERTGSQDNHPSWAVNRDTGFHNCFSCGYKGNFLGLVMDMKFRNDAFRASKWIRQYGVNLQAATQALRITWDDRRQEPELEEADLDLGGIYAMFDDPPAQALADRELSAEACKHYGVRWEAKHASWIIPIRRPDDAVLIGWQVKADSGRFFRNFPTGVDKGRCLFGWEVFEPGTPAIVVESPLDAVRIYTAGISGAVATYGAEWTNAQMRLLVEDASELIAGFDNDKSGRKATQLLLHGDKKDKRRGYIGSIRIYLANYDGIKAKDPGEMSDEQIHDWAETSRFWATALTR